MSKRSLTLFAFAFFCLGLAGFSSSGNGSDIKKMVEAFKKDPRGPYQGIRWFCPDGTILPPKQRCPRPGGIQHALLKEAVRKLGQEHGIYLGQILAGTRFEDFLDAAHQSSRMKQYQMEKYLQAADDGWIMRRARYYRGAVQIEDEEAWGERFLTWLLAKDDFLTSQFFLCRQMSKSIPHHVKVDQAMHIRALAKAIADSVSLFLDIRSKIHGEPDATDIERVKSFRRRYRNKLSPKVEEKLATLEAELEAFYRELNVQHLKKYLATFPLNTPVGFQLRTALQIVDATNPGEHPEEDSAEQSPAANHDTNEDHGETSVAARFQDLAHLLWVIREHIASPHAPDLRLAMLDLSNEVESILIRMAAAWQPTTLEALLEKDYALAEAAAGCGYVEIWEWQKLEPALYPLPRREQMSLAEYLDRVKTSRREVEWGAGMFRAVYNPVVSLFSTFEPLAGGFIDDGIRSSVLLPFGEVVGQLSDIATRFSGLSNEVLGVTHQSAIHGLNPGIAVATLEVVTDLPESAELSADKIYMLRSAPADLKPVAGIATVSEGNLVSHVQLLARNLGIPNAVISLQNLEELLPFSGTRVFYAVSPRGRVILKPASEMTAEEKALVEELEVKQTKIFVPTNEIDLTGTELRDLKSVRATDSGKICGPKAANLGQLKSLFPDKVPPGLVIPFAVFRRHLDQPMPGTDSTYWQFLQQSFRQADKEHAQGQKAAEVERRLLARLARLHEAIREIPFLPEFKRSLQQKFRQIFGVALGDLPIFIRSDTNMEDLENFTGAGLNLTVVNVLEKEAIFQAIRDVWASPFTERSSRWRRKYLTNPENVYPSLLLLPSVNVDKSGVMITSGLSTSNPDDITVAFNWGVGGAVAGQAAETYLLRHDGVDVLLSPARQPEFVYLPLTGGKEIRHAHFHKPILNRAERHKLRVFAAELRSVLPGTPGIKTAGPFDVELGFWKESIWLFQVRPFVENKLARSSAYLKSLDSDLPEELQIALNETIKP